MSQNLLFSVYAVLPQNIFCRDLRAFVWRKMIEKLCCGEKRTNMRYVYNVPKIPNTFQIQIQIQILIQILVLIQIWWKSASQRINVFLTHALLFTTCHKHQIQQFLFVKRTCYNKCTYKCRKHQMIPLFKKTDKRCGWEGILFSG